MFYQLIIPDFIDFDSSKIEYLAIYDGVQIKVNPSTINIGNTINIVLDFDSEIDPITNISYFRANNNKTIIFIPLDTWGALDRV